MGERRMLKVLTALAVIIGGTSVVSAQDLKLGHYFATEDFRGKTAQYFADQLQEIDEDITVNVFPNESLVKGREALQATSQGVVDIYSVYAGYLSGQVPLINVFSLPFPPESYDDAAMYEMALDPEVVSILDKTFAQFGVKYLGVINSSGPAQLFLSSPVESVSGISGLKLRGAGGLSDEALRELGASVVLLSAAEQFLALQTGTVDGISTTWSSYINYGLADVAPTYLAATVVRAPYLLLMNAAKYDSLSDEQKQSVDEAVRRTVEWSRENFEEEQSSLLEKVKTQAETVVEVSAEEQASLREQMQPIYKSYTDDNGEDAQKLMDIWQKVTNSEK
ncbi:TRAP transporter substrate-binding protein [Notoacmeibacter ruber]|uniref:TRAP transporter substrate-binding protein n=2 Tax=Notoacmeibacter ruber TaxID=2670375 RepID=A0A3L7J903_9HYPH|nr:TRAP transporter substrate-binding protein [Notoacmeibacter ruber]